MVRAAALSLAACCLLACSATKQIDDHRSRLTAATAPQVSLADKRDALGESVVEMMTQALRLSQKDGRDFVVAYTEANGDVLDRLAAQLREGIAALPAAERESFGRAAAAQPYARQAPQVLPKFIAKYRQLEVVNRLTGSLNAALLSGGGSVGFLRPVDRLRVRGPRLSGGGALVRDGQLQSEGCAGRPVGVGSERDPSAEPLDGLLGDREADARAGVLGLGV